ncbi:MAG: transglutaminase domain-containing protein [Lachnospiraceae bacterium]|nr:transglutaminase domain-containing protein [Lachnospiraceae bacterium]
MYEQYEQKMERLARILRGVKKGILILIALLIPFLFICFGVGFRYRDMTCASVQYGETPKPSSGITSIGETTYEYRSADDEDDEDAVWSTEVPTLPGRYRVRAHTVSFLGIERDSDSTLFEITPRKLTLWLPDYEVATDPERVVISEDNYSIEGFVYGDRLTFSNIAYEPNSKDGSVINYRVCAFGAVHPDGTDATDCYSLPKKDAKIRDTRIRITVTAGSRTLKYDGDPFEFLHYDEWEITSGELAPGHTAEFHCEYAAYDGLGSTYAVNTIDPSRTCITDRDGNDVTDMYKIQYVNGNLQLQKRSLTITSGSATKEYDGTPLTCDELTIGGDGLAGGDQISVHCTGSQTQVGTSANSLSLIQITNDKFGDALGYYNIIKKTGTLKVTGRKDNGGDGGGGGGGQGGGQGGGKGGSGLFGELDSANEDSFDLSKGGFGGLSAGGLMDNPITLFSFFGQSSRRYYFRECTYGEYDGHTWYRTEGEEDYRPDSDYFTGKALEEAGYQRDSVTIRDLKLKHLVYPYFMTRDPQVADSGDRYNCETYASGYTSAFPYRYDDREEEYQNFVYENYLTISDELKNELYNMATNAGISPYSDNLINEIAWYIQNAASYDLNFPDFPDDQDMVLYFLTVSKKGICQHYAAAAAMMYRAFGIPSRFVVGFVQNGMPGKWVNVTTNTGHAWCEVYIAGTGWIPVEVTGSGTGGSWDGGLIGGGDDISDWPTYDEFITVSYDTLYKEYDGVPVGEMTFYGYHTQGKLRDGDTVVAAPYTLGPNEQYVHVGEYYPTYYKELSVKVYDANGLDVSYLYYINIEEPKVTIVQRGIGLMIYADTQWSPNSIRWTLSGGSLADGDTLRVVLSDDENWDHGFAVYIGQLGERTMYVEILNERGVSVTEEYNINYRYATE